MGLFSRRTAPGAGKQAQAIQHFWAWWDQSGAAETARAAAADPDLVAAILVRRIAAVHRGLEWEVGPATGEGPNLLVVSSGGAPELRGVARRWRLAAPPANRFWEFSDSRRPATDVADAVLELGGERLDLSSVTVGARVTGAELDVAVHHPAFARLPEQARLQAVFVILDQTLGEVDVETWIGAVTAATVPAMDGFALSALPAAVDELRRGHTSPDGEPTWVVLKGQTPDGSPVIASTQVPLKATTAPQFDTYVGVGIPYGRVGDDGLPTATTTEALERFEDHLVGLLEGSGRVVARETHQGRRLVHVYVDGTTPAADQARTAAGAWPHGKVRVESRPDPGWRQVAHLRS